MQMSGSYNRDRSRSPMKNSHDSQDMSNQGISHMNPMLMNGMYQQGSMMMGNMYRNMMMQSGMMGPGMMQANMDMIANPSGMDMLQQPPLDITSIANQNMNNAQGSAVDINMMGGMMMEPSMMAMGNINNIGVYPMAGTEMQIVQEKKEMVLKHCKLIPPGPERPNPPVRTKPLGCRTIFVGGLPEKIRESVVREIFEQYGHIQTLRLSKKNFCHIRYERESSVDEAMVLSGYQLKLTEKESEEDGDSALYTGWMHVDYALSRDDQHEYERKQRQAMRVQQQQLDELNLQQQQQSRTERGFSARSERSQSPMLVQPYSSMVMSQVMEKVKGEETFSKTLPTLLAWLERGECSKKNANQFYSMIQATNSHIRRLFGEKMQAEEELQECKERVKTRIHSVIETLEQVAKVFAAASHKRVWDHFTKAQRKNIDTWQKMAQEFATLKEEFHEKFETEESDSNAAFNNKPLYDYGGGGNEDQIQLLKRENESLQFQLEAYKNEVEVIKTEAKTEMDKFKAQFIARQALQGAQNNPGGPPPLPPPPPPPPPPPILEPPSTVEVGEARLIAVLAAFLQVHPGGARLEYVVSYVRSLLPRASHAAVHSALSRHPDTFSRSSTGLGADIQHRWHFIGFQDLPTNGINTD